jgi:hypothetical protein
VDLNLKNTSSVVALPCTKAAMEPAVSYRLTGI